MMMDFSAIIIQTVLEPRTVLISYIMYAGKKLIQSKKWACAHQFFLRPQAVHQETKRLVLSWVLANALG